MQRGGGGTQNEEQKRALRRRLRTEWCAIAKTKVTWVVGIQNVAKIDGKAWHNCIWQGLK